MPTYLQDVRISKYDKSTQECIRNTKKCSHGTQCDPSLGGKKCFRIDLKKQICYAVLFIFLRGGKCWVVSSRYKDLADGTKDNEVWISDLGSKTQQHLVKENDPIV